MFIETELKQYINDIVQDCGNTCMLAMDRDCVCWIWQYKVSIIKTISE